MNAQAERLISADSHIFLSDEHIKGYLSRDVQDAWTQARAAFSADEETLREGQPPLQMEDFVDLEAARDPGYFDPAARLQAMDRDQVEAEVLFSEVGGAKLARPDLMGVHWQAGLRGFNDAMADFAAHNTRRLLCAYQLPLYDIDFAIQEVDRLLARDARAVQIPSFPTEFGLPPLSDAYYEPLWARLQEAGIAVMNHLDYRRFHWDTFRHDPTPQKGIFTAVIATGIQETICHWILGGTLARFPGLRVVLVEPGLGWLPWFLGLLDQRMHEHYEFPGVELLPSEYFKRQMTATFMHEPEGLASCYKAFGPECLMWSTDFPHPATCWPNSQQQVKDQFAAAGIPAHDRRRIVCDNAAGAFNL
jgi:predicted TIM-barrel fold metal-dependent hydrolase